MAPKSGLVLLILLSFIVNYSNQQEACLRSTTLFEQTTLVQMLNLTLKDKNWCDIVKLDKVKCSKTDATDGSQTDSSMSDAEEAAFEVGADTIRPIPRTSTIVEMLQSVTSPNHFQM